MPVCIKRNMKKKDYKTFVSTRHGVIKVVSTFLWKWMLHCLGNRVKLNKNIARRNITDRVVSGVKINYGETNPIKITEM